jgi:beta-glucosidase
MKFSNSIRLVFTFVLTLFVVSLKAIEPWQNTALSFKDRTNDLVSRLTLEEKTQMMCFDSPAVDRLGIPAYNWWNECLHGVARSGLATVFPEAIGMAAMWDKDQMFSIANVVSDEARAKYNDYQRQGKSGIYKGLTFWTPNINIFRDPRWGRGMETYGEDPYLTAEMAIPFVKGLQGDDPRYLKLVSTVKHFAVHSGPESTRHSFDVWPSDYDLAETYLPHFKRTIEEGGAYSVMCAYQSLKGAPCCGSKFLENILRNQWNFKGYIVSDCGAIQDFYEQKAHHIVATPEEASAMAVKAGTDLNCGSVYAKHLLNAVNQRLLTEDEINVAVKRLIMARMKLGQFDPPEMVKYSQIPLSVIDSKEHRSLALESAQKSMVLLENKNNILPFSKSIKHVAVIGPNADNREILLGNYNGYPSNEITPLKGIIEKLPKADVKYAQGCRLAKELPCLKAISPDYFYTSMTLKQKGLNGEYFSRSYFKGKVQHRRIDKNIDFVWWTKAPFEDMKTDSFSVRWKAVLVPPTTGKYTIGGEAFNGFDIYIDGKLFIHGRQSDHDPRKEYEFIELEAGKKYSIRFDYPQNNSEYATARLVWDIPNPKLKAEAVELAKNSDVVVLCMGLSPMLEGEEMKVKVDGFAGGDRLDIKLPDTQTELIREIQKLSKPTVLVLLNGSALAFNWEAENIPAIIEAWYPGQAGGTALADVIFGDYNPAGRLPLTFYKNIDQIPAFDVYDMKGKTYRYFDGQPLYEFGYGLSYSTFEYSLNNSPEKIKIGDSIPVSVSVKNTGKMDGDDVVQLYVSLPDTKLKAAIRSLQGFKRIHLKAGETQTVGFTLKPEQFAARDTANNALVEPGNVLLSVGGKQPDKKSIEDKKVVQKIIEIEGNKMFINN